MAMGGRREPPPGYDASKGSQDAGNQKVMADSGGHNVQAQVAGGGPFGKGAPPPPDYSGAAQNQFQSGQESINQQTQANRPNQNGPFGSVQWTQGPDGQWTQNSALSGGLGQAANNLQGQVAGQGPLDNGTAARNQAINSAYGYATSRLDPQWKLRDEQLQTQLANQGLSPGSAAYEQATSQQGRDRNDAYNGAMASAIGQGTAAQQATFGENLAAQMAPYQQMAALHGLGQAAGFNSAGAYSPLQALQAAGLIGNYGLQGAQMNNQVWSDLFSGAGQLGSGAMMASDERLKSHVERLDVEAEPGIPVATFQYKHEPGRTRLGVIAQDVEKVRPDAVETGPDGIKRVDYSKLKPFGVK
jgi:hypothetical protein